jgi:hypothetical protein
MMRPIMRTGIPRSLSPFLLAAGVLIASSASAQGGDQSAIAEDLFRQAKALMDQQKYKEACEKFESSNRLDPSTGTLLNLADCNQKLGKIASAWAQFGEAAVLAKRAGTPDRAQVAQDRAAALEPRLSRVRLVVGEKTRVPGLEIHRDELSLDKAIWNGLIATDPGPHVFKASAPGKKDWTSTVNVQGEGKSMDVVVPPLADAPVAPKPTAAPLASAAPTQETPPPPPPPTSSGQATAGYVIGGIGVAGLAVGGIVGLLARSDWKAADCPGRVCKTQGDQDSAKSAKTKSTISTAAFVGGGILLATGVTLVLVAPDSPSAPASAFKSRSTTLAIAPSAGPGAAGLDFVGSF